jgi:hypothetical protein
MFPYFLRYYETIRPRKLGEPAGSQVPYKALAQVRATSIPPTLKPKHTFPFELSLRTQRFLGFDGD